MLIFSQKYFQFCIPPLKTRQPISPFVIHGATSKTHFQFFSLISILENIYLQQFIAHFELAVFKSCSLGIYAANKGAHSVTVCMTGQCKTETEIRQLEVNFDQVSRQGFEIFRAINVVIDGIVILFIASVIFFFQIST